MLPEAMAQQVQANKEINRISTASRVPADFWNHSFTYYEDGQVQTRTLEAYRGKAILLDFWSVHCGACIHGFPALKALQQKYGDGLVVLLVNSQEKEKKEEIDRLFARLDDSYRLPSLVNDTFLHQLFPHGPIPHYVWIGPDGKVDAFTRGDYVTDENIRIFLRKHGSQ